MVLIETVTEQIQSVDQGIRWLPDQQENYQSHDGLLWQRIDAGYLVSPRSRLDGSMVAIEAGRIFSMHRYYLLNMEGGDEVREKLEIPISTLRACKFWMA